MEHAVGPRVPGVGGRRSLAGRPRRAERRSGSSGWPVSWADVSPDLIRPSTSGVSLRVLAELSGGIRGATDVPADLMVTGVSLDSRAVRPGDLYAALPGYHVHGGRFAADAVRLGAVAVITDDAGRPSRSMGRPTSRSRQRQPAGRLGRIAATVYGDPGSDLTMIGITGTNGKTTTAYLLESALRALGRRTGLIGTVETRIGEERLDSAYTTPESPDLHAFLAVMRERGADTCVMEVSSRAAPAPGRRRRLRRRCSPTSRRTTSTTTTRWTTTSREGRPLHARAVPRRSRLRRRPVGKPPARASHRAHDDADHDGHWRHWRPWRQELMQTGRSPRPGPIQGPIGTSRRQTGRGAGWPVSAAQPAGPRLARPGVPPAGFLQHREHGDRGRRAHPPGFEPHHVEAALAVPPVVPGRMEVVAAAGGGGQPRCIVDFAHTPDAIDAALTALRPSTPGRLIAVLGAGGDGTAASAGHGDGGGEASGRGHRDRRQPPLRGSRDDSRGRPGRCPASRPRGRCRATEVLDGGSRTQAINEAVAMAVRDSIDPATQAAQAGWTPSSSSARATRRDRRSTG